jgi:predicted transcriptional regulator
MKTFLGNPYSVCAFLCVLQICKEVAAPTSFVLEQGQPNLSFVKGILEAMMDAGECVASVTSAKKSDFIELHPADFVSHCASSYLEHKPWLERLCAAGRLSHGHIDEQMLKNAAPEVTAIVKKARSQRLRAKRSR